MKKLFIIAAIALLGGMMTACSSSDDEFNEEEVETALRPLLGYWQYTGQTIDSRVGYVFKSNGEVLCWEVYWGGYKERHFGTYGIDDEQHFYLKGDSKENNSEGEYYYVTEFFPDSMTTFSPNSPELLQYKKYKKIGGRP
jgi:hypothetical protein